MKKIIIKLISHYKKYRQEKEIKSQIKFKSNKCCDDTAKYADIANLPKQNYL